MTPDELNYGLCHAASHENVAGVRAALAAGADVNARVVLPNRGEKRALTPLEWARIPEIVDVLVAAGANINATNAEGYTALHIAVLNARDSDTQMVECFLRHGANPNTRARAYYATPLDQSMLGLPRIAKLLLDAGAVITRETHDRASGFPEMVALLEEWPIRSSTASDNDKRLMLSARVGDLEAITMLLNDGASATTRDMNGAAAFDHALRKGHLDAACELERAAVAQHASADLFVERLDDSRDGVEKAAARIDLEARNAEGLTALMLAARYRRRDAIRALVSLGANIDQRNRGSTALVNAIESGDLEGMRLLVELGANVNLVHEGANPVLAAACRQRDSDLLRHLLVRGLDIAPYPRLVAPTDSERLIANARRGVLPVEGPAPFALWSACPSCATLPEVMGWCRTMRGEHTGEPLPEVTGQFELIGDLWKCPQCHTYYEYEQDHDNGIPDGWDSVYLRRVSKDKALEILRGMERWYGSKARLEREIAAVTKP